jgi:hypothetical protein
MTTAVFFDTIHHSLELPGGTLEVDCELEMRELVVAPVCIDSRARFSR